MAGNGNGSAACPSASADRPEAMPGEGGVVSMDVIPEKAETNVGEKADADANCAAREALEDWEKDRRSSLVSLF